MEGISREAHEKDMQIMDERFKRDGKRLESLEEMQKEFLRLSGQLTEILKNQSRQIDEYGTRIFTLEKRPGAWLDRVAAGTIAAVIAAVVTYFMALIRG